MRFRSNIGNFNYIRKIIEEEWIDKLLINLHLESDYAVMAGENHYLLFKTRRGRRGVVVSFGHPYSIYKYYPKLSFKRDETAISYMIVDDLAREYPLRLMAVAYGKDYGNPGGEQWFLSRWRAGNEIMYVGILNFETGVWSADFKKIREKMKIGGKIEWKRIGRTYNYPYEYFSFK